MDSTKVPRIIVTGSYSVIDKEYLWTKEQISISIKVQLFLWIDRVMLSSLSKQALQQ